MANIGQIKEIIQNGHTEFSHLDFTVFKFIDLYIKVSTS